MCKQESPEFRSVLTLARAASPRSTASGLHTLTLDSVSVTNPFSRRWADQNPSRSTSAPTWGGAF